MASAAVMPQEVVTSAGSTSAATNEQKQDIQVLPAQGQLEKTSHIVLIPVGSVMPDAFSPAVPAKILFGGLRSPELMIIRPVSLRVERHEDSISVAWDELDEFGNGQNLSEALDDFGRTISELYWHLAKNSARLSDYLLEVREKLSHYIAPRTR